VVTGRSLTWAGRPHAISGRPMLIHTCHAHAVLCRGLEESLSERHGRGMEWVRHGMCESITAALCKSNGKVTILTLCGPAWEQDGMCELALHVSVSFKTHATVIAC
jgi:hypothetical protein